jgi:hypothetical protein
MGKWMYPLTPGQILLLAGLSLTPAEIYFDATYHRIGKIRTADSSLSAGAWGLFSLIPGIGFLGLFAYLLNRPEYIRLAQAHPVAVHRTRRLITYLLILAASGILTPYWWLVVRPQSP